MPIWKTYYVAKSTSDALHALANCAGPARLVAGGTDLLLDLQQGRHVPVDTLVDVTEIADLRRLELRTESLFIGAALPLNRIVHSPLVLCHAQALYEAAGLIGGQQVRNTATLGGNVAHALPAGDGTIALLSLGAQAEVADLDGTRLMPVEDLFRGPGKSALDPHGELLVGFHLPLRQPGQASAFQRIMRPQGVAIAILNMSIWMQRCGEQIMDVRIAVGPAGPTPFRARQTEQVLRGKSMSADLLALAVEALLAEAHFRTSPHRSSSDYRKQMAGYLLNNLINRAWQRATETEVVFKTNQIGI